MNKVQTDARIQQMVQKLQHEPVLSGMGISVITAIMNALAPQLVRCFMPSDGNEPKKYVEKRFDINAVSGPTAGYDKRLLKATTRRAMMASRRAGTPITFDQARVIALSTLDNVRLADANQLSMIIKENDDPAAVADVLDE